MQNILIVNLVKRDIRISKKSFFTKYILFVVIFISYILLFIHGFKGYKLIDPKNLIYEIFKGTDYIIELDRKSDFPIMWLFINCFIIYSIGDYMYKDIKSNCKYALIRVGRLREVYIAKIIWSMLVIFFYYMSIILITYILGYIFKNDSYEVIDPNYFKIDTISLILIVFLLYFMTTMSFIIIFFVLTLKIKPTFVFLIELFIFLASVFSTNKYFLGQQSLIIRHTPFSSIYKITVSESIIVDLLVIVIFLIVGIIISDKKEIF